MNKFESTRVYRTAALASLAGLAVSGCSEIGNTVYEVSETENRSISSGFVPEGVNFRTDPAVHIDKGNGITNSCANLPAEASFSATSVIEARGDANGPWIGYEIEDLPESVQKSCADDADGIIWVAKTYVSAETFVPEAITVQN